MVWQLVLTLMLTQPSNLFTTTMVVAPANRYRNLKQLLQLHHIHHWYYIFCWSRRQVKPFCFLFKHGPLYSCKLYKVALRSCANANFFPLFYSLNHSQVMNHLGSLRMMRGGNMDHTLSWSFIPGIIMGIYEIHHW